jgi:hypothetical protein
MTRGRPLDRTPFYFLGPRPYREAELAAHIHREHRRGRSLEEILRDPYLDRCGGRAVVRAVLRRPELIRALGRDVAEEIVRQHGELTNGGAPVLGGARENGHGGPAHESRDRLSGIEG